MRRNALVTTLAAVAAAALVWFLAQDPGERGEDHSAGRGEAEAADSGPENPDADLEAPVQVPGSEDDGGSRTELAGADLATPSAPGGPAAAEDAPTLTGLVVDPYGAPVAGARVTLAGSGRLALDFVPTAAMGRSNRWTETTDEEGRFSARGPSPGTLRVGVRAPTYAPHSGEVVLPEVDGYELDPIVLQPGAILEGLVVDHVGLPVAGAELFSAPEDRFVFGRFRGFTQTPLATTDAQGFFRVDELALGAWRLRVETEDHPTRTFEGFAERAGEVVGGLRFELEPGAVIAGVVTGIPKGEKATLEVRATPASAGGWFRAGADLRSAEVAKDGSFEVRGLKVDSDYEIQARLEQLDFRGGFNSGTRSPRVAARSGQLGVQVPYQPEAVVTFQVVDAKTGEALEAFQVEYGFRWPAPFVDETGQQQREFPEGQVRLGNLRPSDDEEHLQLQLKAVGYQDWERDDIPVAMGQEIDLGTVALEALPTVRVTVLDGDTGLPVEGARVSLREERQGGGGPQGRTMTIRSTLSVGGETTEVLGDAGRMAVTDAEGLAVLNSLEGRSCRIQVSHDDYAPGSLKDVFLPQGEVVDQTVELGPGGSVLARVVDEAGTPVLGVRVDHRPPSEEEGSIVPFIGRRGGEDRITDDRGEVRFQHLAAGVHRFRLASDPGAMRSGNFMVFLDGMNEEEPGWEEVEVVAGAESEVLLVQTERGSLAGKLTEAGAELVGATVRVSPAAAGNGPGGMRFSLPGMGGAGDARTDSNGRYRSEGLEPGDYTVTVTHPRRRMPAELKTTVEPGENRFDIDLPVSILEGRITSTEGEPLAGVEVRAQPHRPSSGGGRSMAVFRTMDASGGGAEIISMGDEMGDAVTTDSDGRYSLRGVQPDVELVVRASGPGVQPLTSDPVVVAPDSVRGGVDLVLEAGGNLSVEVFQADGTKADFAVVRANYLDEVPEGESDAGAQDQFSLAQAGLAKLEGLRPGRWQVSVGTPGDEGSDPEDQEVEVKAADVATLTFHLN